MVRQVVTGAFAGGAAKEAGRTGLRAARRVVVAPALATGTSFFLPRHRATVRPEPR
jgi:hypothetical protein